MHMCTTETSSNCVLPFDFTTNKKKKSLHEAKRSTRPAGTVAFLVLTACNAVQPCQSSNFDCIRVLSRSQKEHMRFDYVRPGTRKAKLHLHCHILSARNMYIEDTLVLNTEPGQLFVCKTVHCYGWKSVINLYRHRSKFIEHVPFVPRSSSTTLQNSIR